MAHTHHLAHLVGLSLTRQGFIKDTKNRLIYLTPCPPSLRPARRKTSAGEDYGRRVCVPLQDEALSFKGEGETKEKRGFALS